MTDSSPAISNDLAAVRDHTRVFGKYHYVYAVISRRSRGLSIGVNLNPDKVCNFNCVYCEVDRQTPPKVASLDVLRLKAELTEFIDLIKAGGLAQEPKFAQAEALTREIKDIAFSGDGEPTLVHNFCDCVRAVAEVKKAAHLDRTKLVLITDGAGLDKEDVRKGLELLDNNNGEIWGKLDAGSEDYFRQINRSNVQFERVLRNLLATARVRPIVIQSLFLKLKGQAMPESELAAYCQRLNEIGRDGGLIKEVHVYTVARPTAETSVSRLSAEELDAVARVIRERTGLSVCTFP